MGNLPCSVRLYRVINNCFLALKLDDRLKKRNLTSTIIDLFKLLDDD